MPRADKAERENTSTATVTHQVAVEVHAHVDRCQTVARCVEVASAAALGLRRPVQAAGQRHAAVAAAGRSRLRAVVGGVGRWVGGWVGVGGWVDGWVGGWVGGSVEVGR
jgi:hypothetical protein